MMFFLVNIYVIYSSIRFGVRSSRLRVPCVVPSEKAQPSISAFTIPPSPLSEPLQSVIGYDLASTHALIVFSRIWTKMIP